MNLWFIPGCIESDVSRTALIVILMLQEKTQSCKLKETFNRLTDRYIYNDANLCFVLIHKIKRDE